MKFRVGKEYRFRDGTPFENRGGERCQMCFLAGLAFHFRGMVGNRLRFTLRPIDITLSRTAAQRFVVKEGR